MNGKQIIRYALAAILGIVALNAFGGGYYGLTGAKDVPLEWLEGSLFDTYLLPSLVLLVVIGGSSIIACLAVFGQTPWGRKASYLSGLLLLTWIIVQLGIIGYVSWLQPAMFIAALVILLLTRLLPRQTALSK